MKRVFALVLSMVLSVLLLAPAALAEGNDLTSMSLDDLLKLRRSVENEINARLASDASILYSGVYYVGESIKEGSYVLTYMTTNSSLDYSKYGLFLSNYDYTAKKSCYYQTVSLGQSVQITLKTGMVLVTGFDGHIQAAKASYTP